MSDEAEPFDWGSDLSEDEWRELAAQAKASELQLRFVVAKDRGCSDVEAAAQAGYSGTRDIQKSQGHKAKNTPTVKFLQELAEKRKAELSAGLPEAPDREMRRKLLGRQTKSKDPRTVQAAIIALNKMDEEDREMRLAAADDIPEPAEILKQIAAISPMTAAFLSAQSGVTIPGIDTAAVRAWVKSAPAEIQDSQFLKSDEQQATAIPFDSDIVGYDNEGDSAWENEQQAG